MYFMDDRGGVTFDAIVASMNDDLEIGQLNSEVIPFAHRMGLKSQDRNWTSLFWQAMWMGRCPLISGKASRLGYSKT